VFDILTSLLELVLYFGLAESTWRSSCLAAWLLTTMGKKILFVFVALSEKKEWIM
jgi:hypothetical protein